MHKNLLHFYTMRSTINQLIIVKAGGGQTHKIYKDTAKFKLVQSSPPFYLLSHTYVHNHNKMLTNGGMTNTFSLSKLDSSKGAPFKQNKGKPGEPLKGNGGGMNKQKGDGHLIS